MDSGRGGDGYFLDRILTGTGDISSFFLFRACCMVIYFLQEIWMAGNPYVRGDFTVPFHG